MVMRENVIEVKNLTMHFNLCKEKIDSLKEYCIKLLKHQLFYEDFVALHQVTFNVKKGDVFGVIGLNGSGKSTLLKLIAGVLKPTEGTVFTNGKIAPLIELGAGFDTELTGRENIYLNGSVLGFSKSEMDRYFDNIVAFSELQNFLDVPLKNYSSGMIARIGFAIATVVNPDILILDEILAVGDFHFQRKCEDRILSILERGATVIVVSHSIEQIERLCKHVLWLDKGKVKMLGETFPVCSEYKLN